MLFRTVPSLTPYGLRFLKIGGLQLSYPLLSQERVKLRTSNLAGTFTGPIQVKAHSKFRRKWSVGVSRDCLNYLGTPVLSQERVKLQISNLAGTFTGPIRINAHWNFGEMGAWAYPGTAQIFGYPYIISGTGKATDFKFCRNIHRVDRNKRPWKKLGIVAVGVVRESRKFRAPIYRTHRAVIFATAQLSCFVKHLKTK